ncbi:PRA1-like protein [Hamiltosporidium magnivora]|uniref:PRA1 family protein n=1 Tax=Hamiltosporidium magnivora TaxID=148818 RepID=A0A4Q9LDL2_9MICR|nr:PRA1-like protein [Hamiltosporidium magnivora]
MHGSLNNSNQNINSFDKIKEIISSSKDIKTFFDKTKFSLPKDSEQCKKRFFENTSRFKGNYLIIAISFTVLFFLFKIFAIPLALLWFFYIYFVGFTIHGTSNIVGKTISTIWIFRITVAVSVIYSLLFGNIIMTGLAFISLCGIAIISHCLSYKEEEEDQRSSV